MCYDRGLKHENMYHDILTEQWRSVFCDLAGSVFEDAEKLTRLGCRKRGTAGPTQCLQREATDIQRPDGSRK